MGFDFNLAASHSNSNEKMNNMSDTPRTKAFESGKPLDKYECLDFASQLERELTEAKDMLSFYKAELEHASDLLQQLSQDRGEDSKRLDWLETHKVINGLSNRMAAYFNHRLNADDTWRTAIDAAMKKESNL